MNKKLILMAALGLNSLHAAENGLTNPPRNASMSPKSTINLNGVLAQEFLKGEEGLNEGAPDRGESFFTKDVWIKKCRLESEHSLKDYDLKKDKKTPTEAINDGKIVLKNILASQLNESTLETEEEEKGEQGGWISNKFMIEEMQKEETR